MKTLTSESWIFPNWSAPDSVRAVSTTRIGGFSQSPYDGLNLALHVGDNSEVVDRNRQLLRQQLRLPSEPVWMEQVHGINVVVAERTHSAVKADACVSFSPGNICVVMTADCMPILLADLRGRAVAAVHAGWRGLLDGVIEATYQTMTSHCSEIVAWIGPSISQLHFEVGDDVRDAFLASSDAYREFFIPNSHARWQADLVEIAKLKLHSLGVANVFGGDLCTYSDESRFFSYRREKVTGRMSTMIWLNERD